MSKYDSYAYDPQGKKHTTTVKNGQTFTSDGQRLGAGWTSQTAGGIYQMGSDGKGTQVQSHNAVKPVINNTPKNNNSYNQPSSTGKIQDDYTHVTMKLNGGENTTVHRDYADKYADMGYEMGAPTMGGSKYQIEQGIRNDTAGSDWEDDGYNNGFIKMRNNDGMLAGVNARYADKYFDKGYTMDARSQSINRALQSGYHEANDAVNSAIRGGTYNPNYDYSRDNGWDDSGGYKFGGGDGRGNYNNFGNQSTDGNNVSGSIDRRLGGGMNSNIPTGGNSLSQSIDSFISNKGGGINSPTQIKSAVPINGNPNEQVISTSNGYFVNSNGQMIEISEDDYINTMFELYGF